MITKNKRKAGYYWVKTKRTKVWDDCPLVA